MAARCLADIALHHYARVARRTIAFFAEQIGFRRRAADNNEDCRVSGDQRSVKSYRLFRWLCFLRATVNAFPWHDQDGARRQQLRFAVFVKEAVRMNERPKSREETPVVGYGCQKCTWNPYCRVCACSRNPAMLSWSAFVTLECIWCLGATTSRRIPTPFFGLPSFPRPGFWRLTDL